MCKVASARAVLPSALGQFAQEGALVNWVVVVECLGSTFTLAPDRRFLNEQFVVARRSSEALTLTHIGKVACTEVSYRKCSDDAWVYIVLQKSCSFHWNLALFIVFLMCLYVATKLLHITNLLY